MKYLLNNNKDSHTPRKFTLFLYKTTLSHKHLKVLNIDFLTERSYLVEKWREFGDPLG